MYPCPKTKDANAIEARIEGFIFMHVKDVNYRRVVRSSRWEVVFIF